MIITPVTYVIIKMRYISSNPKTNLNSSKIYEDICL